MSPLQDLYGRYLAAWAARDPDAIVALHTPNTTFWLHHGQRPVSGVDAVRDAFAAMFAALPGFAFEIHRTEFGSRHWVLDWTLRCELSGSGRVVSWDCIDLVTVTDDWRVSRKDTFIDGAAFDHAFAS